MPPNYNVQFSVGVIFAGTHVRWMPQTPPLPQALLTGEPAIIEAASWQWCDDGAFAVPQVIFFTFFLLLRESCKLIFLILGFFPAPLITSALHRLRRVA